MISGFLILGTLIYGFNYTKKLQKMHEHMETFLKNSVFINIGIYIFERLGKSMYQSVCSFRFRTLSFGHRNLEIGTFENLKF